MTKIKSFSVDNGDMFYIRHNSDNFTIIDCNLSDNNKEEVVREIIANSKDKNIIRFISTHPDTDHIKGLAYLNNKINILNFYCVKNKVSKDNLVDIETEKDFKTYYELRDSKEKAFYIHKGCTRHWMNQDGKDKQGYYRGSAGINILWPDLNNQYFKNALKKADNGESPNNISPIIKYSLQNGATVLWMGDLETDFMKNIIDEIAFPKVNILFAPHHGRDTGKIPEEWLKQMDPDIIVIGEAPSEQLNYYQGYNTITQNSSGNITFICESNQVSVYVENPLYEANFLHYFDDVEQIINSDEYYIGTFFV